MKRIDTMTGTRTKMHSMKVAAFWLSAHHLSHCATWKTHF